MSQIDPQVLYLILTKVAAKENFYGYDAAKPLAPLKPGTITPRSLGEVYDRITGGRSGARQNWAPHLQQLHDLVVRCGLPPLTTVVDGAEGEALTKVHAAAWPPFHELKKLYGKRAP